MYKRFLLVLAVTVIAVVFLWSDDEQPADKEKVPAIADIPEPHQTRPVPWQFRSTPGEPTQQPPRGPAYTAQQGGQSAPGYPYSGAGTSPYTTPYPQPRPYDGYGFQPQPQAQEYGMVPQPQQYPGSGMPYGYSDTPTYRYRPLGEKETARRHRGYYHPRQDYAYPGAPPPSYGQKR